LKRELTKVEIDSDNYRKMITYEVNNTVGKMTEEYYTQQILPELLEDLHYHNLTLCQDMDSAHDSKLVKAWCKQYCLPVLTLPGVSPDVSILESLAHPLKLAFHGTRCVSEVAGLNRFRRIFEEELDQSKIQDMYEWYMDRLHAVQAANGQMTKY